MVATAARRNAAPITTGRIRLHRGDGTALPVADDSLDALIGVTPSTSGPAHEIPN